MSKVKPNTPKGTRDFSPAVMVKRNYIFDTIKAAFQKYGFLPIETPAMENTSTLMGKYGEEGDRLIFKILNSGDFTRSFKDKSGKVGEGGFTLNDDYRQLTTIISEKALRYDLTVPFARYVVQHQNDITFPFKRYQIQPVWRADRPQKGRYREFYQCDADVIGSKSLFNEIELVQLMDEVFSKLNISTTIKINNRKILSGIAEIIGEQEKIVTITVAIDKLDKIGIEGVNKELIENGINQEAIEKLQPLIKFEGTTAEKLTFLKQLLATSEVGLKGIDEVEKIISTLDNNELQSAVCELDITLARGLNYYTGAIFEVKSNQGGLDSSICGGGRYDDLTGVFGLPNTSGVGISFGADRIFDVMDALNLFPASVTTSTQVLFVSFGEPEQAYCIPLVTKLRNEGISAELYPDAGAKMKKQMAYANAKNIPYVIVVGSDEMESNLLTLKIMETGNQEKLSIEDITAKIEH